MMMFPGGFKRIDVIGLEHLEQADGPLVVISNHLTLIDVVVLGSQIRNFNCVVKASLWKHPYFGRVVRACDFVPNFGGEAFIEGCQRGFATGRPLIIFPQGTRTPLGHQISFERGAAHVAVRTGATIIPVIATCYPPFLEKTSAWYDIAHREPELVFSISAPISIPPEIEAEPSTPKKVRRLTGFLESYYEQMLAKIENR